MFLEPVYLSIKQKATGNKISELLKKNGYTVKDVQEAMGFENPQAVYKWSIVKVNSTLYIMYPIRWTRQVKGIA